MFPTPQLWSRVLALTIEVSVESEEIAQFPPPPWHTRGPCPGPLRHCTPWARTWSRMRMVPGDDGVRAVAWQDLGRMWAVI